MYVPILKRLQEKSCTFFKQGITPNMKPTIISGLLWGLWWIFEKALMVMGLVFLAVIIIEIVKQKVRQKERTQSERVL